jgi:quercetin dioxygenase-like cupin family protein
MTQTFALLLLILMLAFNAGKASAEKNAALPDPLLAGWQGSAVCEKLHEDVEQRILKCSFAPGVGHERHFHAPHFGYALSGGKMRLTDANKVREVEIKQGSSFTSSGTPWHEVINIGTTTVEYLIVEPK